MIITQTVVLNKSNNILEQLEKQRSIVKYDVINHILSTTEKEKKERHSRVLSKIIEYEKNKDDPEILMKIEKIKESEEKYEIEYKNKISFIKSLEKQIIYIIYNDIIGSNFQRSSVIYGLIETFKTPIIYK